MKYASDFRAIARRALSGRWALGVVAGLIALVLGGVSSEGPKIELNIKESGGSIGFSLGGQSLISTDGEWGGILAGAVSGVFLAALVLGVLWFILGSIIRVGYARFNLELVDRRKEPELNALFGYFSHWKNVVLTALLEGLYVFLWSLLLIIPGIVAGYSYAMTGYILAEHPELTPGEALERSKEMMSGNRFRLFCLQFSFIGWSLLCALTLGIGNLWLTPYRQAATAAFYREVSGTEAPAVPGE